MIASSAVGSFERNIRRASFLPQLSQTKIEQLRAGLGEHDVAWFQIAVRDSFAMCFIQRIRNLDGVLQYLIERQWTFLETLRQRLAFQILHHQEISSVLLADVVEDADVGMIQAGDGARFAVEPLAQSGSIGKVIGKDFDGNDALQAGIPGAVHLAHPARANCREDFVGAQTFASEDRQRAAANLYPQALFGTSTQELAEYNPARHIHTCKFLLVPPS